MDRRSSSPVVIKTDADALGFHPVGRHLMAQPAFKKKDVARFGRIGEVRFILWAGLRPARRCRHETLHPRIFKFQAGATGGSGDVIGAADKRKRMQMQGMSRAWR